MRILPTTVDLVQQLRNKVSRLHRTGQGRMQDLRDRVARRAGYSHWNHVMWCLEQTAQREPAPEFHSISTYQRIAEKVEEVSDVLEDRGISMHPQSVCAQIFKTAKRLGEDSRQSTGAVQGIKEVFSMMHADRIADAILGVANEGPALELLRRIASKNMDLALHAPSQGKDALWELELLAFLRRKGARAWLQEPDIVVLLDDAEYPIACKKVNSENGTENQVRSACRQLRNFGSQGVVALSIDALFPEETILRGPNAEHAGRALQKIADQFLDRHDSALRKAVANERCDAIVVSITGPVELTTVRPRWSHQTELVFWSASGANEAGRARLRKLRTIVSGLVRN